MTNMANTTHFYMVLIHGHITVPGDERSRTHPGHGYPEHTVDTVTVKEFANEHDLRAWLGSVHQPGRTPPRYRVLSCTELHPQVTLQTQVLL